MKIIVISGSRNPEGQTAKAIDSICEGLLAGGADIETFFLPQKSIERCRQCEDNGWGICISKGECIIKDDLAMLIDKIRGADAVVFATPVYFGDLSESLRAFLDRLRRIARNAEGQTGIKNKPVLGICVAGGGGGGSFTCATSLEKILASCGFDAADIIPCRRQNSELKASVLKETGVWFADQLQVFASSV
jgi:multimeric flavodoxin WrbA